MGKESGEGRKRWGREKRTERCLAFICRCGARCFVYGFDTYGFDIHTVFAILIFNLRCSLGDT